MKENKILISLAVAVFGLIIFATSAQAAPSCTGYDVSVASGNYVSTSMIATGANRVSWECTDFAPSGSLTGDTFKYTKGKKVSQTGVTIETGKPLTSNYKYINESGVAQKRVCNFTVWAFSDPKVTSTCTGTVTVNPLSSSGQATTLPNCKFTYYAASIPSGSRVYIDWDFTGADKVTFECTDFACSNNICTYNKNGRKQQGENWLSVAPIKSDWKVDKVAATWIGAGTESCKFTATNTKGSSTCTSGPLTVRATDSATGICGTAGGKVYGSSDTSFGSDTFCYVGKLSKEPQFPSTLPTADTVFWSCGGETGIQKVNCSASRTSTTKQINGACGVAQGSYSESDSIFRSPQSFCSETQKFCAKGTIKQIGETGIGQSTWALDPNNGNSIAFPEKMSSVSWICQGLNCPANDTSCSPKCTATRGNVTNTADECGTANGKIYENNAGFGSDTLCKNSTPATPSFAPNAQGFFIDATWTCGAGTGKVSCSAHKKTSSSCGAESGKKYSSNSSAFDSNNFCAQGYELVGSIIPDLNKTDSSGGITWQCQSSSWLKNIFNWLTFDAFSKNDKATCSASKGMSSFHNSETLVSCGAAAKNYPLATQAEVPIANGLCSINGVSSTGEISPKFGSDSAKPNEATWNCINKNNIEDVKSCTATRGAVNTTSEESKPSLPKPIVGICGSAAKTYSAGAPGFGNDTFCKFGDPTPGAPEFPKSTTGYISVWRCPIGLNSPVRVLCTACRNKVSANGSNSCKAGAKTIAETETENGTGTGTTIEDAGTGIDETENSSTGNSEDTSTGSSNDDNTEEAGTNVNTNTGGTGTNNNIVTNPVIGSNDNFCGPAARKYTWKETAFDKGGFCSSLSLGGARGVPGKFIERGQSETWYCVHTNTGGENDSYSVCKAMRENICTVRSIGVVKGICGSATGDYYSNETALRSEFCKSGNPEFYFGDKSASISQDDICNGSKFPFPTADRPTQWTCVGSEPQYNSGLCTVKYKDYFKGECGSAAGYYNKEERKSKTFRSNEFCKVGDVGIRDDINHIKNADGTYTFIFPTAKLINTKWKCFGSDARYDVDCTATLRGEGGSWYSKAAASVAGGVTFVVTGGNTEAAAAAAVATKNFLD
ncbi:MAG TPA: hypothetical protein P5232_01090 [Candidatus Moranbacteria bacterium]|nr:hypothetical protein [Candidatus Moranbacteria bacterium]